MRKRMIAGCGLLLALMLTMLPVLGGNVQRVAAQDGNGLGNDNDYESPQFSYTVTWGDDWSARIRDVTSNSGGFDSLVLRGAGGTLRIVGQSDADITAAEAVEERMSLEMDSEDDIVSEDLEADVPTAELEVGRDIVLIEGHTLEESGAVVVVTLTARDSRFEEALASAQDQVLINDSQILIGEPLGGEPGVTTEEATEEASETPVDLVVETEEATPEATEEATEEPTEVATEEATEEVTEEPTEEATVEEETPETTDTNIDGNVYSSSLYGYSFEWDDDLWEVGDELLGDTSDGVLLNTDTGGLTIWAWDGYGDDPVACLDGESDYYETEDPTVTDWTPAEDADGEPIRDEGRDFAYGVFELTYTDDEDPDAEPVELVDYIECRSIPGQGAVVVIFGSSTPANYNDHLDNVLDVADTLVFEDAAPVDETPEDEQTPESTPVDPSGDTGLDGSTFTSPSFGFTLDIPAGWTVESEVLDRDDEQLMLSNGVSDVTLWATDAYSGDLEGCIEFVTDEVALDDLEMDVTADGDPFQGSDANGAYANFVYTGDEGDERAFFVACRYIEENVSVLILTQDVAYEDYTSQRQERRALQDAIEMP